MVAFTNVKFKPSECYFCGITWCCDLDALVLVTRPNMNAYNTYVVCINLFNNLVSL